MNFLSPGQMFVKFLKLILCDRQVIVANFVKALHKETRSDIVKFGVPDFYRLSEVEGIFDQ